MFSSLYMHDVYTWLSPSPHMLPVHYFDCNRNGLLSVIYAVAKIRVLMGHIMLSVILYHSYIEDSKLEFNVCKIQPEIGIGQLILAYHRYWYRFLCRPICANIFKKIYRLHYIYINSFFLIQV